LLGTEQGQWSIDGNTWHNTGHSILLDVGSYTVQFKAVEGYHTPASKSVEIVAEQTTEISVLYSADEEIPLTWDNGTEPVLEEGNKVIYVTPNGAAIIAGTAGQMQRLVCIQQAWRQ